jgi:hypothetical protein
MDIEIARHLYLLQKDSAIKKGILFRLTFADWTAIWGDQIDQRGGRPGDLYMERINKADGYVLGNLRISKRLMR